MHFLIYIIVKIEMNDQKPGRNRIKIIFPGRVELTTVNFQFDFELLRLSKIREREQVVSFLLSNYQEKHLIINANRNWSL